MIRLSIFILASSLAWQAGASDAAAKSPEHPVKNILIMGDSITAGYGLDPEEAYPALLQQKIDQAGLKFKVVNGGLSGDTSAGGLRRISWMLRQRADILLLELGGNDGLRGIMPDETRKNLEGIITKTKEKYPHAQIILAGMQMPDNMGEDYVEKYKEVFPGVARKHKAVLIPFLLEGVGGHAELNQPDRIHPTAAGHKIVAETVWKVLRPILNEQESSLSTHAN